MKEQTRTFTKEQKQNTVAAISRDIVAGKYDSVNAAAAAHGISGVTYYNWRKSSGLKLKRTYTKKAKSTHTITATFFTDADTTPLQLKGAAHQVQNAMNVLLSTLK